MAIFSVDNIRIDGIAAAVPKTVEYNRDYDWISEKERELLIRTTGVEERRIASSGQTTVDMCQAAAEKLIDSLQWESNEIDILVFVSQSQDYFLPASAVILQDRLGLPKSAMAFDIGLGCSGYVYGLSVIASLMATGKFGKGLLLAGDKSSHCLTWKDKSTYPLFGDAGSATALSYDASASRMDFNLQSDGSGHEAIIIRDGGVRNPIANSSFEEKEIEDGIWRSGSNLELHGLEVFEFTLREVAPNIRDLFNYSSKQPVDLDFFVMHQANLLMNETVRKKLKFPESKVPYVLKKYGNTSSASIPLTIVSELNDVANKQSMSLLLSGFGVGLSWGSALIRTDKIICPSVVEI